jgi:hypothetical protein
VLLEGLDRGGIGCLLAEAPVPPRSRDELGEHERDERDPSMSSTKAPQPAEDGRRRLVEGPSRRAPRAGVDRCGDRHRNTLAAVPSGSHDELPLVEIVPGTEPPRPTGAV